MFDAPSLVHRIFAGFIALLAHGCLRSSDAQHSEGIHLTEDALVGVCWKMKRRKTTVKWAALRVGASKRDWAKAWMDDLALAGLPAQDFIVCAPTPNLKTFTTWPASYWHISALMRAILLSTGMPVEKALNFTPHSWRHLYPTMARQLQMPAQV